MKGRQRSTMLVLLFFFAMVAFAVPAKPGLTRTLTITDGSTVNAMLVGDEYLHYWLGDDGKAYQAVSQQKRGAKGGSEDGDAVYQAFDVEAAKKSADERRSGANQQRARRLAPRKVGSVGNISGEKKGIIILVNFKDKAFTATQSDFYNLANTVNYNSGNFKGSMYDYFYAQSDGQFRLTFDVVGPYTVSKNYAYYGANDSNGSDVHPAEMVIEAVKLADNDVNFANYDWDNDGFVDQVYVVYAGKGEADGGAEDTIWPHEYDLYSANYYGDGEGIQKLDDVKIKTYACGGEQNGSTGETAGIGTMCHEFSHCLGYPDFYDTDYSGGQGMGYWDLMNSGSYNGNGYRPAGYTSYERWVAGWKTPIELEYTQTISNMAALQTTGSNSYIIYNKGNSNEYYLLENRQKTGWDTNLPGAGLLILHVDYDADVWSHNKPNDDPSHQRMTWIAADNEYQYNLTSNGKKSYTRAGMANDPFPYGSKNSFGKNSKPAATLYNANSDGTYYLDSSITDITQNSDGTISFNFNGESNLVPVTPCIYAEYEVLEFSTTVGTPETVHLEILSEGLTEDITLTLSDDNGVFSLSTNTISRTEDDATIDVTFNPSAAGTYEGFITLTSAGADPIVVLLSATATDSTTPSLVTLLYEGLRSYKSEGDGTQALPTGSTYLDYNGWASLSKVFAGGTKNAMENGGCLKLGSTNDPGSMTTGSLSLTGNATLTFYLKQYSGDTGKLTVTVTNNGNNYYAEFTPSSNWTHCTLNLTNITGAATITLATSNRAYVDEIMLTDSSPGGSSPTLAYYQNADGTMGSALKTAMCNIIKNPSVKSYDYLWTAFQTTDVRSDGKIWDMYSNITNYTPVTSGSIYEDEGDSYNREHSFPKSWFGGENKTPMFSDLHHIYPTDSYVNGRRSNYPYGENNGETYTSQNYFSNLGKCTYPGYTGTVFEPADEYKGDFARTYFYMVTCYEEQLSQWVNDYSASTEVEDVLDGNKYPGLQEWQLNMLMKWAKNDPVSEKEINRNNAVYAIQNNRNPFIDYPGLEEYIWGNLTTTAFDYDNYLQPARLSFSATEATATLGEDFTEPTLTTTPTGLTVTYSSSEPSVATVNSSTGAVTLVAAGSTTITATFAGNSSYSGGTASYTLTVSNPALVSGETLLYESLSGYSGSESSQAMSTSYQYLDYKQWNTITSVFAGANSDAHANGGCLKFGSGSAKGSMTTGNITLTGGGTLTFYLKKYGDDTGKLNVTVTGATADVTEFTPASNWTLCTVNLSKVTGNVSITLATTSKRAYVDEIKLTSNGTLDLADDDDNASIIAAAADNGGKFNVTLKDRTLYRDGKWNTLCLPFDYDLDADDSPIDGGGLTVMAFDETTSTFDDGTLTLNFTTVFDNGTNKGNLVAGTPYLIKWDEDPYNTTITDPVFYGVTIDATTRNKTCDLGDGKSITFCGTYGQLSYDKANQSTLFIGEQNKLYYPLSGTSIGAQRAYFQMTGIEAKASAPGNGGDGPVRAFVLNFDDDKSNGIENVHSPMFNVPSEGWYTLDGRRLSGKPAKKGIYVNGNRKVLIK